MLLEKVSRLLILMYLRLNSEGDSIGDKCRRVKKILLPNASHTKI